MQSSLPEGITPIRYLPGGNTADLLLACKHENEKVVVRSLKTRIRWSHRTYWRFLKGISIRDELSPYPYLVNSLFRGKSKLLSQPYEVVEYIPGDNLKLTLTHAPGKVEGNLFSILLQIADAITHLHKNDFIHLDVKPENILLLPVDEKMHEGEPELQVKLTDFDLARKDTNKRHKLKAGSVHYMPPEQLVKGEVGIQNDIFAFGVTAYYAITKRLPFGGLSEKEVIKQHLDSHSAIKPPKAYNPDIMQKLNDIVISCLENEPDKRFPSMPYLLSELQKL